MKDFGAVEIILNPKEEVWRDIVAQMNKTEGWSFAYSDYETWKQGFKQFWFYCAVEKSSGKPVASVTLAHHESEEGKEDDDLYAVGMYYCNPEWRGSGLASRLFDIIMEIAGDSNMTLNGVMKMAPLYSKKYGFSVWTDHAHNYGSMETKHIVNKGEVDGYKTKLLSDVNWDDVVAYDRTVFPRDRAAYLKLWIDNQGCYTKIVVDQSGKVVGLGCIREDVAGDLSVGPFYADSKEAAQSLFAGILEIIDLSKFGKMGFLFPDVNKEVEDLLSSFTDGRFSSVRFTQSQFTKKIVECDDQKVYSVMECASSIV